MQVPFSWTPGPPASSVLGEFPANCVRLYPDRAGLHGLAPLVARPAPLGVEDDDLGHVSRALDLVHRGARAHDIARLAGLARACGIGVNADVRGHHDR